jgi:formylglycine-generating enzyme required for sulfatase activity
MALHLKIAAKAAIVAASLAGADFQAARPDHAVDVPETVLVGPTNFAYRMAGDFQDGGRTVDAPRERRSTPAFEIMKYQLATAQYDACAADGACPPRPKSESRSPGLPAVLLSFEDAKAYAAWLSARTGDTWRPPSDLEWRAAAGSRARDDALGLDKNADPSARWLSRYDTENATSSDDQRLRPLGGFGVNENGVYDLSGNVWEWTEDCFIRYAVDPSGVRPETSNCGVRVVEGEHRAYIIDFIRDARAGGCSAGKPPSHLGVRLVREIPPLARLPAAVRHLISEGFAWL